MERQPDLVILDGDQNPTPTRVRNASDDERADQFKEKNYQNSSFDNPGFQANEEHQNDSMHQNDNHAYSFVSSDAESSFRDVDTSFQSATSTSSTTPSTPLEKFDQKWQPNSNGIHLKSAAPFLSPSPVHVPEFVAPVDNSAQYVEEFPALPTHTVVEKTPTFVRNVSLNATTSSEQFDRRILNLDSADAEQETCPVPYALPVQQEPLGKSTETAVRDTDLTTTQAVAEEKIAEIDAEWRDVMGNGSLMQRTIRKGTFDTRPVRSSRVTIKCSAVVLDNNDLDPASVLKTVDVHDNLRFTVSDLEVIQGLELAVQLMNVGEIAEVKIDPRHAYGEQGQPETGIPADATLLYTIELLKVEPPVDIESLTTAEKIEIANHKIDRGNFWYRRKESMLSLSLYQRAVALLESPATSYQSPEDSANLIQAKARAYGNLSSAQVEEGVWDEGLKSVDQALRYEPNNGKLWCRKIRIQREKGQFDDAVETCEEVLRRGASVGETFSKKARDELTTMRKKKRQADENEKKMYQRMMGSSPKPASEAERSVYLERKSTAEQSASSSSSSSSGGGGGTKWFIPVLVAASVAVAGILGLPLLSATAPLKLVTRELRVELLFGSCSDSFCGVVLFIILSSVLLLVRVSFAFRPKFTVGL